MARIEQVAPTSATVLVLGESGTGKELVARAFHARSRRRERPLVSRRIWKRPCVAASRPRSRGAAARSTGLVARPSCSASSQRPSRRASARSASPAAVATRAEWRRHDLTRPESAGVGPFAEEGEPGAHPQI
ncbi:MAG TPA: sigma 54-interacting transcriptional regulator [Haliangium sp.]|nr:sigma 54-interacting transcriptional regulator [Haliangium sp.]